MVNLMRAFSSDNYFNNWSQHYGNFPNPTNAIQFEATNYVTLLNWNLLIYLSSKSIVLNFSSFTSPALPAFPVINYSTIFCCF